MKKSNNGGITLIALVITIIVLLILAGISIAMLTGSNGILNKANEADVQTVRAEARERINLALDGAYTDLLTAKYVKGSSTTLDKDAITKENGLSDEYTVTTNDAAEAGKDVLTITWSPKDKTYGDDIKGTIQKKEASGNELAYTVVPAADSTSAASTTPSTEASTTPSAEASSTPGD